MNKLNVLYQFNNKYAPFAGVSITSLFENNKSFEHIRVYIMIEGVSDENLFKFEKLAKEYNREIITVQTEQLVKEMIEMGLPSYRGSYAANMRLFFPSLIKDDIDKFVYLDSDTVVLGDLHELIDIDMGDNYIAMAYDSVIRRYRERIGIKMSEGYYNSGVIVFNVKRWIEDNCSKKIVDHIKKIRSRYVSPDQDLLNIICKNKIKTLPIAFNFQPIHLFFKTDKYLSVYNGVPYYSQQEINDAIKQPYIIHFFRFAGEFPWSKNNIHPSTGYFDRYLKISLWKDYIKEKESTGIIFFIEKLMYKYLPKFLMIKIFSTMHERFIMKADDKIIKEITQGKE